MHQECYGVPSIPEGKWLCTRCGLLPNTLVKCALCPHYEGAFKQTEENNWAHTACAHYIEETGFSNETYLEPIIGIDRISPSRLKLKCFLCKVKSGAPIQCSSRLCNISFHVRCAQLANFHMDFTHKRVYCPKHTPHSSRFREYNGIEMFKQLQSSEVIKSINHQFFLPKGFHIEKSISSVSNGKVKNIVPITPKNSDGKISQDLSPIKVSQLPPVLPEILFSRIINGVPWINSGIFPWQRKLEESPEELENFLSSIARYWSLKRDIKGVPLIRRLLVESDNNTNLLSEEALSDIINQLRLIRYQLEMIRSLIELSKRIFELKMKDLQQIFKIINLIRNPSFHEQISTLRILRSMDKHKYFEYPVSIIEVPDYLDIVKMPMDFSTMEKKILAGKYLEEARLELVHKEGTVQERISLASWELFRKDFELICSNASVYNAPKTKWYKAAVSLKSSGLALIYEKEKAMSIYLKKAIDWLNVPIADYLKGICYTVIPYSIKAEENFIQELTHKEPQKQQNSFSIIDVEF